jgi:hypothetical protein
VRRVVEEPIKVEHPPQADAACASAPPAPGHDSAARFVGIHDPGLAAVCIGGTTADDPGRVVDPPRDDAATIAQLGMALYLLGTLHGQDKPGDEHASRSERVEEEEPSQ